MQQTLLTLGALMIITMTSINQQRANHLMIEGAYIREQENAALDYASMRLEYITSSKAYDESTTGGAEYDISNLTSAGTFGPEAGESDENDYDDIDDYHEFNESIKHALSADTFRFDVTYSVRYINTTNPSQAAAASTAAKELTISVVSQDTIGYKVAQYSGSKISLATDSN